MLLRAFDKLVLGHPKLALATLVALIAFFAFWIRDFRLDASSDSLVLEHDKDLRFAAKISRRYGDGEFVVVTFTPREGDLFAAATLRVLKELRDELRSLDRVSSVASLLDVPLVRSPPVPLSEVAKNVKTLENPGIDVELARAEFRDSPVYRDLIVSTDLRSTALLVTLAPDDEFNELARRRVDLRDKRREDSLTPEEVGELEEIERAYAGAKDRVRQERHEDVARIRAVLERYRDRAELFLGGVPMIVDDIVSFIRHDLAVFGLGMVLFLMATLWLIFRRLRWIALPMLCCACSVAVMMGLLGLVGWEVTVVSSNFVSLQLIFTMSLAIHLVVRYREVRRERPDDEPRGVLRETVARAFVPCLYASLTTIAGFASLVFCDILPVVTFGWMMTLGLAVSLVVTFLLFPLFLILLKHPPVLPENEFGVGFTSWFAKLTEHRGGLIFVASAIVAAVTIAGALRLEVENSFIDYFKESTEIYRGMEFIDRKLGGTTPLDVILEFAADDPTEVAVDSPPEPDVPADAPAKPSDDLDVFDEFEEFEDVGTTDTGGDPADREKYWFTPAKLERIAKVHDYLDALPETGKVVSLGTIWKLGRDLNGGEPLDPFTINVLFQKMPDEFKRSMIEPYASTEHDQARISVRIRDSDRSLRRDELLSKIERDLRAKVGLAEDDFRVSGLMVLYNNMLQSLFSSQIKTIGFTVAALMLMFLILFRSLKVALIAIFPNLLSSLVVLGVMGLAGVPLDVMTITIVAISVGIAVDDTIHYIHRYERELAIDGDPTAAMRRSHRNIGNAMFYTSITITFGFSILCLSSFIPSILFGLLTALAMLMALVSALSLLPRLILVLRPFAPRGSTPSS